MHIRWVLLGIAAVSLAACGTSSVTDASLPTSGLGSAGIAGARSEPGISDQSAMAEQIRTSALKTATARDKGAKGYKIGSQDLIEVTVFKVPDLSKTLQVSEAGTVNFPLIGETMVAGKTPRDVEVQLTKALGRKYLQNPQVSVLVKEYNSQRVTVEGAVKKPGVYPLQGGMSLLQVIATAQGLTGVADDNVVVFRDVDGKRTAARFDISKIREGADKDPQLMAGDVIVANTSATQKAFNNILKMLPLAGVFALL